MEWELIRQQGQFVIQGPLSHRPLHLRRMECYESHGWPWVHSYFACPPMRAHPVTELMSNFYLQCKLCPVARLQCSAVYWTCAGIWLASKFLLSNLPTLRVWASPVQCCVHLWDLFGNNTLAFRPSPTYLVIAYEFYHLWPPLWPSILLRSMGKKSSGDIQYSWFSGNEDLVQVLIDTEE